MNKLMLSLVASTFLVAGNAAFAQTATDTTVPGHPRVSEVDSRLQNQQTRIDNGLKNGTVTPAQAAADENRDEKVSQQLSKDEAKNGGHITKAEQKNMNKKLNKNSRKIHHQKKKDAAAAATPAQ